MAQRRIELLFSDTELGTEEFGFIMRRKDPDDEDSAYAKHVRRIYRQRNQWPQVRCHDGTLIISTENGPPAFVDEVNLCNPAVGDAVKVLLQDKYGLPGGKS